MIKILLSIILYYLSFILFYKISITYKLSLYASIIFVIIYLPAFFIKYESIKLKNKFNSLYYSKNNYDGYLAIYYNVLSSKSKMSNLFHFMFYKVYELDLIKFLEEHKIKYVVSYLNYEQIVQLFTTKDLITDFELFGEEVKNGNYSNYMNGILKKSGKIIK